MPRTGPPYPLEFRWEAIRMVVRVSDEEHPIPQKLAKERPLPGRHYPKMRWGAGVTSMALLACVGVDEEGFREGS